MPERDQLDFIVEQWQRERPDLDPSPMGVIGRISRLSRDIERRLDPVYRDHRLEAGLFDVLASLRRAGSPYRLRPSVLADALMLTSSAATKRLDRLERTGLIEREPDPDDRRAILITLTETGRELVDRAVVDHLANEHTLLAGLTKSEQRQLASLLKKLQLAIDVQPNVDAP